MVRKLFYRLAMRWYRLGRWQTRRNLRRQVAWS